MGRIRDSGIATDEAFLQHMYNQSNEELYIGRDEIPAENRHEAPWQRRWSERHWYTDAFDGSASSAIRERHRQNVFQALER